MQANLAVSRSSDASEVEADQTAKAITQTPQGLSEQPKHLAQLGTSGLDLTEESGQPLPLSIREAIEPSLGYDLGAVRVHTNDEAAMACRQLRARAFTVSRDIFFNEGQFAPESAAGKSLMAHELTHTVQQSQGVPSMVQRDEPADEDLLRMRRDENKPSKLSLLDEQLKLDPEIGKKLNLNLPPDFEKVKQPFLPDSSLLNKPDFKPGTGKMELPGKLKEYQKYLDMLDVSLGKDKMFKLKLKF